VRRNEVAIVWLLLGYDCCFVLGVFMVALNKCLGVEEIMSEIARDFAAEGVLLSSSEAAVLLLLPVERDVDFVKEDGLSS
jgi:hypothetical protein